MVWISNLGQLRCSALYGAHRGRAAPGRLTLPDGRGLSTHDAAASAVVDDPSPSFGGAAIVWWLWLPRCASGAFSHPWEKDMSVTGHKLQTWYGYYACFGAHICVFLDITYEKE